MWHPMIVVSMERLSFGNMQSGLSTSMYEANAGTRRIRRLLGKEKGFHRKAFAICTHSKA